MTSYDKKIYCELEYLGELNPLRRIVKYFFLLFYFIVNNGHIFCQTLTLQNSPCDRYKLDTVYGIYLVERTPNSNPIVKSGSNEFQPSLIFRINNLSDSSVNSVYSSPTVYIYFDNYDRIPIKEKTKCLKLQSVVSANDALFSPLASKKDRHNRKISQLEDSCGNIFIAFYARFGVYSIGEDSFLCPEKNTSKQLTMTQRNSDLNSVVKKFTKVNVLAEVLDFYFLPKKARKQIRKGAILLPTL